MNRHLVQACVLALVPVGAAVWAFTPMSATTIDHPSVTGGSAGGSPHPALASLDRDAFRAPLWVAPPAPPAPPPPPAALPPLKLQLLAVVHEGQSYKAMLYDPDSDKILVVGDGETVAGKKVEKVTAEGVQIRDGAALKTLALRSDAPVVTP